jgi:hypothetical protein
MGETPEEESWVQSGESQRLDLLPRHDIFRAGVILRNPQPQLIALGICQ